MTKPFDLLTEALDHEDGDEDSPEFLSARADLVAAIWKASGKSQTEFAQEIGFSQAYAQKILTQGFAWGSKEKAITSALGLPPGCLSTESSAKTFIDTCPIFITTVDALVHFNSEAMRAEKLVPTAYILEKIKYEWEHEASEELKEYFTHPEKTSEPDDKDALKALEELLILPVNAVNNPDEVMRMRSKAIKLSVKTRLLIAKNITVEMQREKISTVELATRAGISESAVVKLLDRRQCSMATLFGIASALSVSPARLMVKPKEKSAAAAEQTHQRKEYEDLPLVARGFLSDYLQLIREKTGGEPTGRAASILILTPILHYAVSLLEKNANSIDSDTSQNLAGIMGNLERNLRVLTTAP
jgi:transcriptional regulator with XRE-family HTH domain